MADKDKNTEGIFNSQKKFMGDALRKEFTINSTSIFTALGGFLGYDAGGLSGAFLGAAGLGIFGLGVAKAGTLLIDTIVEMAVREADAENRKADAENTVVKLGTKPSDPPENVI